MTLDLEEPGAALREESMPRRTARILFHFPDNPFILLEDPEPGGL